MSNKNKTKLKETEIGLIPEEWDVAAVYDIADILGGGTPDTSDVDYWGGDIPWLSVNDFNNESRFVSEAEKRITQKGLEESSTQILKKGQLIISARGTVGVIAQVRIDMAFNQSCYGLIGKKGISNDFLYYLLKNCISDFKQKSHGAVFDTITRNTFKDILVTIPTQSERERIAEILSSLDDKIELNRKIITNLEKLSSSLFKKWFVDIGNELPGRWKIGKFGDLVEITSGKRPGEKQEIQTENFSVPLLGASSVMGYVKEYLYNELILITGRVGTHGVIQKIDYPCWPSDNTLVIKSKFLEFAYQTMKSFDFASLNRGSTQPLITQGDLKNIEIIIPENTILEKFEKTVAPFAERVRSNEKENQNLSKLRDSLLPRLMSGKLRV
jgi:type I restriction enzyme S subunit